MYYVDLVLSTFRCSLFFFLQIIYDPTFSILLIHCVGCRSVFRFPFGFHFSTIFGHLLSFSLCQAKCPAQFHLSFRFDQRYRQLSSFFFIQLFVWRSLILTKINIHSISSAQYGIFQLLIHWRHSTNILRKYKRDTSIDSFFLLCHVEMQIIHNFAIMNPNENRYIMEEDNSGCN